MWLVTPAFAFSPAPDLTLAGDPGAGLGRVLAAGDFDGDGFGDLAAAGGATVVVFGGSATGLGVLPVWSAPGSGDLEALDVDGDGIDDLLVARAGLAELYLGSPAGLAAAPVWSAPALASATRFASGDLNADGYDDLVIADPRALGGQGPRNLVNVYAGGPLGPTPNPAHYWSGARTFGAEVAVSDLDADGHGDVVIGSPQAGNGGVEVYRGTAGVPAATPTWTVDTSLFPATRFGERLAGGVDLDGDGYQDLGIGYAGAGNERSVARVLGGPAGPGLPSGPPDHYGRALALAPCPDVDGDGDDELLVGWPQARVLGAVRGAAGVFDDGLAPPAPPLNVLAGDAAGDEAGAGVAAGDFDGDGAVDVAVGAPGAAGGDGAVGVVHDPT